jgi:hypothetical protein
MRDMLYWDVNQIFALPNWCLFKSGNYQLRVKSGHVLLLPSFPFQDKAFHSLTVAVSSLIDLQVYIALLPVKLICKLAMIRGYYWWNFEGRIFFTQTNSLACLI